MDKNNRIGRYVKSSGVGGEYFNAYIPQPLPPVPTIDNSRLYGLLDQANTALGRLEGISAILPDTSLFLYMYVRKEAIFSSQIEGTQSSLSDLLLFENDEIVSVGIDDVTEVSSYVAAMNYGLERLNELPLSLRLIREIHARLMNNSRGGNKQPGEFRTSQNWIGGSRPGNAKFVPPPVENLNECLDNLEKFLHDPNIHLPILVKAALAHVQFETIHPFLDGNGRLGRLLITLILCAEEIIRQPLLYLSLYFKVNREAYYDHLMNVRLTGDWEAWIEFFLIGVRDTANQAVEKARMIMELFARDRKMIENSGRSTATILNVQSYLERQPISNSRKIKQVTGLSLSSVLRSLDSLEKLGLVKEITGKGRRKIFVYTEYLNILNA